ncbi:endoglucanase [Clostridium zeae]|uniref:Endoglucanase n=1 Tax=Clostridium zeae TaxID=2759022 RepID=A0ABQ1EE40_9CLOT|nr:cellulase family glycosylhydrolase [Clostridium zeae]GFZ32931.1 endoglucanase [Clostridium zeae]
MKKTKKLLMLLTACVLTFSTCLAKTEPTKANAATKVKNIKAAVTTKTNSQTYAESMQPGWNLGNSFDSVGSTGETSWGNPVVTQQLIQTIKSQGFKSIRIPFTAYGRVGAAPNYTIDSTYLTRYAQVVQWALDQGLYVMINIHHDSWEWAEYINADDDNGVSMTEYKAIWTQLANYFKSYSSKVCFESLNEPYFKNHSGDVSTDIQMQRLSAVNTQFRTIVRNSGGNNTSRMLVLPTLNTNNSDDRCTSLYNTISGFNDPYIMATFHYYGYWPFSVNIAGTTTFDSTTISDLTSSFDRVYNHFTANGIGVVTGEYGLLAFDSSSSAIEHGELLKYFDYINYYAKSKGIALMLWDNGNLLNRTSYTWNDQALYNTLKASWTSRNSYSTSDMLFVKYADRTKDISMNLTLNGNTLSSIYNGSTKLVLGTDYTYSNGIVTLKGSYVNKFISGSYGTKATLTMKFSAGVDWNVFLNYYTTPVLSSATGTTSGFNIPVAFNGSKLSTLEAVYSDGSGAGPQNWTTYKQYSDAYTANYSTNVVTLTSNFFSACNDGVITLKLHFQSGEIIQYNITKSGTSVKSN